MTEREREEELTKATLLALNEMKIKFPGKTDSEAEYILDKVCNSGFFTWSDLQAHVCIITMPASLSVKHGYLLQISSSYGFSSYW